MGLVAWWGQVARWGQVGPGGARWGQVGSKSASKREIRQYFWLMKKYFWCLVWFPIIVESVDIYCNQTWLGRYNVNGRKFDESIKYEVATEAAGLE